MEIRKLAPGDRILDYRILERLGEGGFGEVFRAEHEVLGRIVAIKVPREQAGLTALRHEGVVQASLEHPSIVRTLELSISHDPPYVVMEYVDGDSLAEVLRREGALPWKRAAKILLEAARALAFAHSRGVIHGDVKPGNLLIERASGGRVLFTDFGLGRIFEGPQGNLQISRSLELATSGAEVQGTIRYIAPELLRGEEADERSDVYSFGVLLFEILTGRLPEGREVPSDLVSGIPPELDRIFARQFTRRERRPRSLDTTIQELEALIDPSSAAKPAPVAERTEAKPTPAPRTEVVRALPADPSTAARVSSSADRNHPRSETFSWGTKLREAQDQPGFCAWRDAMLARLRERVGGARGVAVGDGRGFDACYGVTTEGEPHHRVYALLLPKLDASTARAAVAEARRIFDQEKGIWEKEVTFWVLARETADLNQVLWTFKSFSMGWWRRRRIVLQDLAGERLYATELGCDPRGNPLKRAFLGAAQEAVLEVPFVEPAPAALAAGPRRCGRKIRGTAWGAGLALLMTFGLLGSIAGVEMASKRLRDRCQDPPPSEAQPQDAAADPPPAVPPPVEDAFTPDDKPDEYF